MKKALIVIDIQNEYSPTGGLPVIGFDHVVDNLNKLDLTAYDLVVSVRHQNPSGLFSEEWNVEYPNEYTLNFDHQITKQTADCFDVDQLQTQLLANEISAVDICGMMTQNCVTYTALSAKQLGYQTQVIAELCTTIDPIVNSIALRALATKVTLI